MNTYMSIEIRYHPSCPLATQFDFAESTPLSGHCREELKESFSCSRRAAYYASRLLLKRGFVVVDRDAPLVLEWLEDPGGSDKKPVELTAALKMHLSRAHEEQVSRDVSDSDGSGQEDDLPGP